jgi:acetyltransferase-like isoleucine patch superfamily enzyme
MSRENPIRGLFGRIFQLLARLGPGASSLRVALHRWRGVKIGTNAWIGYDTIIETSRPHLVSIGNNVTINMRVTIIAHFHESTGVRIEDDVFIGPGSMILPNVTVGRGSVVAAGSVVSTSVPPGTMVQGNPARVIAKCSVPLGWSTPMQSFYRGLVPVRKNRP